MSVRSLPAPTRNPWAATAVLSLAWLVGGCAPSIIELAPPETLADAPPTGPTVSLDYPVDLRPPGDRRDGGYYDSTFPLPFVAYGDVNLRPRPVEALDRAVRIGLRSKGVPVVTAGGDYTVRLYLLRHVGTRDISDAQWVSTLTGGIAGTVGKFLYPSFMVVDAQVRIEVLDDEGRSVAVRDVTTLHVERKPHALTWGIWSLFRRKVVAELFREAFADAHRDLAQGTAEVIDEARRGEPVVAGTEPDEPSQHALRTDWRRADTFDLRNSSYEDAHAKAKYGHERFSLYTGHDTGKGEVVGHIGLPLDTFGYDVGILDRVQGQLDVTVLGLYNSAEGGLRGQVARVGPTSVSLQAAFGANVVVLPENEFRPILAGTHWSGSAIVSHRPEEVTMFAQAGVTSARVFHSFEAFDDIESGRLLGISASFGAEAQVTPTVVVGARLNATSQFQGGEAVDLGLLGPVLLVPQLGIGLR